MDISLLLNILADSVSIMFEYSIPGSRFSTWRLLHFITLEESQSLVDREGQLKTCRILMLAQCQSLYMLTLFNLHSNLAG